MALDIRLPMTAKGLMTTAGAAVDRFYDYDDGGMRIGVEAAAGVRCVEKMSRRRDVRYYGGGGDGVGLVMSDGENLNKF